VTEKNRDKLAELLGAKFVGQVPDVGGGAFGMARLAHILHQRQDELEGWSDADVLAAADASLSVDEDDRLSELLDRRQAGTLTDAERTETAALMQRYQDGLLRKARALREAVRRGLREPPHP
jgi:hypothetical protein